MTFLERQFTHAMYVRKEAEGRHRKRKLEQAAQEKRDLDQGAHDFKGFKMMMKRKYGNLFRAWKVAIDSTQTGRVSQNELFDCARSHGFTGKLIDLWREAVSKDEKTGREDNFIRLKDIWPEAAEMVDEFERIMLKEYGNWLKCWVCALDVDKTGRVDKQQFAWTCKQMDYIYDPMALFDIFDFDLSGSITLEEIDQKAFEAFQRGDVRFERMHGSKRLTSSPKDFQAFFARQQNELQTRRSTINKEALEKAKEARKQSMAADVAMNDLAGLRKQMKLKYGSMMRAWSLLFNKDNTGTVTLQNFAEEEYTLVEGLKAAMIAKSG